MPRSFFPFSKSLCIVFISFYLSGCFLNDINGKVADGYLKGAKICLDINSNYKCDPNEPSDYSGFWGEFTLSVTQEESQINHLIAEVGLSTIDLDEPTRFIQTPFTMAAPAGYTFISPHTTLVQHLMTNEFLTHEEAQERALSLLNMELALERDFIEGKNNLALSEQERTEFARAHTKAQVVARLLREGVKHKRAQTGSETLPAAKIQEYVLTQLTTALPQVIALLENRIQHKMKIMDISEINEFAQEIAPDIYFKTPQQRTSQIKAITNKFEMAGCRQAMLFTQSFHSPRPCQHLSLY